MLQIVLVIAGGPVPRKMTIFNFKRGRRLLNWVLCLATPGLEGMLWAPPY